MTKRQPGTKNPKKSDENETVRSNNKYVQKVKIVGKTESNKKDRSGATQTVKSSAIKPSNAEIDRRREVRNGAAGPKNAVKRKTDQPDDAVKEAKQKRVKRRKFKIGCEHVDFVAELGYKQYIQLVISNTFRYLGDKDVTATFCVSKKWNYVLNQNVGISKRRRQYVEKQIEMRKKFGLVSDHVLNCSPNSV